MRRIMMVALTVLLLPLVSGCSGAKKEARGLNVAEIKQVLDVVAPKSGRPEESTVVKLADHYGGVSQKITTAVGKDIFVIYAGVSNVITLEVSQPAAIITVFGSDNIFTITKTQPFDGDALLIAHYPGQNKYSGADMITAEEFRKQY